jgi:NAD(P)-dependent dehydrogenase (short-subunit alcohol dehydrogenase family)
MTIKSVIVVIRAGQLGLAIAQRVGISKHGLLADRRQDNADAAAEVMRNAGYEVSVATVDVSSREDVHALVETAMGLGEITRMIHAAPEDGDLIYYVPWSNLGFYYNAAGIGYSDQMIHIGTYEASLEQLEQLEGPGVVVEVVR